MTVPRGFDYNFDGERFTSEHSMDRTMLLHVCGLAVYSRSRWRLARLLMNVRSHYHEEGAGAVAVRQVLEWASSVEGQGFLRWAADLLKDS
jgi:hypothetical protein